jgi:hypothetical protein
MMVGSARVAAEDGFATSKVNVCFNAGVPR